MSGNNHPGSGSNTGREAVVGVDIGSDGLRMVRVSHGLIQEFEFAPFDPGLSPGSDAFSDFLRRHVGRFCGHMRRERLWVGCAFPSLQVRHFRVPRVPPRQLFNAVFWTFRKELPLNESETVFDFTVEDEVTEDGVRKLAVTAYTVPRAEVDRCRSAFDKAGLTVDGITIPFFAFRNLFWCGWVGGPDVTAVCLDMDQDSSQVTVFERKRTTLTRVIKAGVSTLTDAIADHPASGISADEMRSFLLSPSDAAAVNGERAKALVEIVMQPLVRIARQVERTLESHFVGRASEHVKRIYMLGGVTACRPVVEELGGQMSVAIEAINAFDKARMGRRAAEKPLPEGERAIFAAAVGLALSDESHTPNLLRTHKEKDADRHVGRFNTGVVLACSLLLAALGGLMAIEKGVIAKRRAEIAGLEGRLRGFKPHLERNSLTQAAVQAQIRRDTLKSAARSAAPIALTGEIAEQTPSDIRLTAVSISMPDENDVGDEAKGAGRAGKGRGAAGPEKPGLATIEGIVLGSKEGQESKLAGYVMALSRCRLIASVRTGKVEPTSRNGAVVLAFKIEASIVGFEEKPAGSAGGAGK